MPLLMMFLGNIGNAFGDGIKYTYSRICCRKADGEKLSFISEIFSLRQVVPSEEKNLGTSARPVLETL